MHCRKAQGWFRLSTSVTSSKYKGIWFLGHTRVSHCYLTVVKNPPANAGEARNLGSIPESGRFPGVGNGNPLQYSCLENPMERGAWHSMGSLRLRQDWAHSMQTQHTGLAALPHVQSSDTCIGRWILCHWITKEAWDFILRMNFWRSHYYHPHFIYFYFSRLLCADHLKNVNLFLIGG